MHRPCGGHHRRDIGRADGGADTRSFRCDRCPREQCGLYGAAYRKPFFEISAEEWDRVLGVNLKGAFLCAKAIYRHMRGRGGKIINITSATVMSGSPLWLHYVSSKGGLIAMTRALAREMGGDNVTVNAIAPGFTLTEVSLAARRECRDLRCRARCIAPGGAARRHRWRRALAGLAAQRLCHRTDTHRGRWPAVSLAVKNSKCR